MFSRNYKTISMCAYMIRFEDFHIVRFLKAELFETNALIGRCVRPQVAKVGTAAAGRIRTICTGSKSGRRTGRLGFIKMSSNKR